MEPSIETIFCEIFKIGKINSYTYNTTIHYLYTKKEGPHWITGKRGGETKQKQHTHTHTHIS